MKLGCRWAWREFAISLLQWPLILAGAVAWPAIAVYALVNDLMDR